MSVLAIAPVLGMLRASGDLTLNPDGCLAWAIVGIFAGWLAGKLTRGRGFGCLGDLLLGLVGAAVGAFVLNHLQVGLSGPQGFAGSVVVAFLGAFALALLGRLIGGNRTRKHEIHVRVNYPPRNTPPTPPQ